ncbi:MAG TPA: amidohydrolase [Thermoanaerobaculia bacterium]|nr:amidohydrolase [Thermoanaerobaculia bacterium]
MSRRHRRLLRTCALVALSLAISGCRAEPEGSRAAADLVLHDARIWTGVAGAPAASALAVRGDKIVAVGSDSEVLALRGPDTRVLDLDGAFVVPGFSDNHTHFSSAARFLDFNIMRVQTQEELAQRLSLAVDRLDPGEWITGGLWGAYDRWTEGSAGGESRSPFTPDLTASQIEELTREHPVFLTRFDGREHAVNRRALELAGLEPARDLPSIELQRDPQGRFTGILRGDRVAAHFAAVVPAPSHARRVAMSKAALAEVRRRGVTSFSDMSDDQQLAIFRELLASGELTARVDFRYPLERWREAAEALAAQPDDEAPWIRLGGLKGHVDGIMGNSTARFLEPYDHDPGNRGSWRKLMVDEDGTFAGERFLELMVEADAAGLQLSIHAIGDEANHLLLDYLEQLRVRNGERDRRFRLVHAQVVGPDDFARFGGLGVVAEVQPYHLSDDMRWMEERIGSERSRGAYAFRSLLDGGAVLSFGSDWPGTAASEYPIDPLLGLYAATTRKTLTGQPAEGWFPEQRLSLEEALRAYTHGSSYANLVDDRLGTLEVGKLADLAVLDRDLLEASPADLLAARVRYTIVGGRIVFEGDR